MVFWSSAIKIVSGTVAGLVIILVGFLIVLGTMDWSRHKDLVINTVETFSDWNVEHLDDIEIELAFPTRIRAEGIELTNRQANAPLASVSVDSVEVSLAPLSALLQDRLHIRAIRAAGARIVVQPGAPEVSEAAPVPFIESVRITDSSVIYRGPDKRTQPLKAHITRLHLFSPGKGELLTIAGYGTFADLPIEIEGFLGAWENLGDTQNAYLIELLASVASDRVSLTGYLLPGERARDFRFNVDAQGKHLAQIAGAFGVSLTLVPPYKLAFSTEGSAERIALRNIHATLGYSNVYGSVTLHRRQPTPYLQADLGSSLLRQKDIDGLLPTIRRERVRTDNIFPRRPLQMNALYRLNAEVEIAVDDYQWTKPGYTVNGLKARVRLDEGKLTLTLNELSVAEGTLTGSMRLNDRPEGTKADLDLSAKHLDLTDLFAPYLNSSNAGGPAPAELIRGYMTFDTRLRTSGVTPHALAARLDGEIGIAVEDGAIAAALVEALGLDVTETLASLLGDAPLTKVQCGIGIFSVERGVIKTKTLLLSTRDSNIVGQGSINLQEETLDLTLEAHAKDFSFPAGQSPIRITGPLTGPNIDTTGELAVRIAGAALLALVQPVLAVAPFLELGLARESQCGRFRTELSNIQQITPPRTDDGNR